MMTLENCVKITFFQRLTKQSAKTGQAKCPYCGTLYKLKAGEVVGHHH